MLKLQIKDLIKQESNDIIVSTIRKYLFENRTNYYFAEILEFMKNTEAFLTIKSKKEILEDEFNTKKSYTNFRGYYVENEIVLFNSKYETEYSLTWLFFHELFHLAVDENRLFKSLLKMSSQHFFDDYLMNEEKIDRTKAVYSSDRFFFLYNNVDMFHDKEPEEFIASMFATSMVGVKYGREWWRRSIAGEKSKGSNSTDMALRSCQTCANNHGFDSLISCYVMKYPPRELFCYAATIDEQIEREQACIDRLKDTDGKAVNYTIVKDAKERIKYLQDRKVKLLNESITK